jgi:tetratricopeptide (TPR) repeat protein
MRPRPGSSVGPYRLEAVLGRGGMGTVYAAWDARLERRVALKEISGGEFSGPSPRRDRLRREARTIARLEHPSIVQVHDLLETDDGDFIVMQYVAGPTLAERLRQGPLSAPAVAALAGEVGAALAVAHRQGLLHRDLKSENVILPPGGGAKVLDFGLAWLFEPEAGKDSASTAGFAGTCRAMSPEQAGGLPLDPRSDLFALGVLLYEAATTISPFADATPLATLTRVCTYQPPPAGELRPDLPPALSGLIGDLLEKDKARRPSSAEEVLGRLRSIVLADSAAPAETALLNAPTAGAGEPAPAARLFAARRRTWRMPAAVLAAAAAFGAGWLAWSGLAANAPLYVVVARTELGAGTASPEGEERLTAAALHGALLRRLAALEGVVALAPESEDPEPATASRLARLQGAGEVLASTIDCAGSLCRATLRRQLADGRLLGAQSFEAPAYDLHLLSAAADTYAQAAYPEFAARRLFRSIEVGEEDYRRFLRLRQQWTVEKPAKLDGLLAALAAIRSGSPSFVDAYLLEARVLRRRFSETRDPGDLQQALALIEHARRQDPADPRPPAALFTVALAAGRLDLARFAAEEGAKLAPGDAAIYYRRALLAESEGRGRLGIDLLQRAIEQRPAADFLLELGKMHLRRGEKEEAKAALEDLLRRIPGYFLGEKLLAELELQAGSPDRAAELYTALLARRRGFTELSNLGLARLLLGDFARAAENFEEAAALAPRSAPAALNLADAKNLAGNGAAAAELYRQVLELAAADPAPDSWQTLSVTAQALAHLERKTEAAAAVGRAVAAAPDNPQAAYEAALVYAVIGEPASALANARRAVKGGFEKRWFGLRYFESLRQLEGAGYLFDSSAPPP